VVLTSLTDHGRSLVDARRARLEPLWLEVLDEFSDEELATAGAVLDRLHDMFEQLAAEPDPSGAARN
jgi:DNA-binding MarR family transcriptional regulator